MREHANIAVIIPAVNEEHSIGKVIREIPHWVDDIIVADNGSSDNTREVASEAGARVLVENRRGYGSACLRGIAALRSPHIVVFLDGDYSDFPAQMDRLVDPIIRDEVDMVIGSRALGKAEAGAVSPQARFGNWLACTLMRMIWGVRFTDLGPFRAIRYSSLQRLGMADPDYGWTVEMQIKAVHEGVRTTEAPVDYRKRIGRSKVSGTVRGVFGAGYKILSTIFISALWPRVLGRARKGIEARLIIFTRYPEPGKTKTRLIPALGHQGAADLQREMTEFSVATAREFCRAGAPEIEVRFEGGDHEKMNDWLGEDLRFTKQGPGDLGDRMARAIQEAFDEGAERAVVIGTDCPGITAEILAQAFSALDDDPVVLGPSPDGGYYLIGVSSGGSILAVPHLFRGPTWGTETVLEETLSLAGERDLPLRQLEPLDDVDRPDDLEVWYGLRKKSKHFLSVVIPALDEGKLIGDTLRSVSGDALTEVIVVDGGSKDDTRDIAENYGATVLQLEPGRARQMNEGAAAASGGILLFLHADTRLPPHFGTWIRKALDEPGVVAGAFEFKTDEDTAGLRFIERWTNFRARVLHYPYGDQGLFLKVETFREVGPFHEQPIMEDFELVKRLRRVGKIAIVPASAVTSGRRWRRLGIWRTLGTNQLAIAAYFLGVSTERIAKWYNRSKHVS